MLSKNCLRNLILELLTNTVFKKLVILFYFFIGAGPYGPEVAELTSRLVGFLVQNLRFSWLNPLPVLPRTRDVQNSRCRNGLIQIFNFQRLFQISETRSQELLPSFRLSCLGPPTILVQWALSVTSELHAKFIRHKSYRILKSFYF